MDQGSEEKKLSEEQVVSSDIARRRAQAQAGKRSTDFVTRMVDAHEERLEAEAKAVEAGIRGNQDISDERMRTARANLLKKNNPPRSKS